MACPSWSMAAGTVSSSIAPIRPRSPRPLSAPSRIRSGSRAWRRQLSAMSCRTIRGAAWPNGSPIPPEASRNPERLAHMSEKVAFITGITGQDGAYLADFLLGRGYIVHGVKRRSSLLNTERIDYLYRDRHDAGVRLFLHYGDMTDSTNLLRLLGEIRSEERRVGKEWRARRSAEASRQRDITRDK